METRVSMGGAVRPILAWPTKVEEKRCSLQRFLAYLVHGLAQRRPQGKGNAMLDSTVKTAVAECLEQLPEYDPELLAGKRTVAAVAKVLWLYDQDLRHTTLAQVKRVGAPLISKYLKGVN